MRAASPAAAASVAGDVGARPVQTYASAFVGFAAPLTADQLRRVRAYPGVLGVEPDLAVAVDPTAVAEGTQDNPPNWGLDRIDQRSLPLDGHYTTQRDGPRRHRLRARHRRRRPPPRLRRPRRAARQLRRLDDRRLRRPRHRRRRDRRLRGPRRGQGGVRRVGEGARLHRRGHALQPPRGHRLGRGPPQRPVGRGDVVELRPVRRADRGRHQAGGRRRVRRGLGGQHRRRRLPRRAPLRARRAGRGQLDDRRPARAVARPPGRAWASTRRVRASSRRCPGAATQSYSGTSMAAPHVAGVAALYKQTDPGGVRAPP